MALSLSSAGILQLTIANVGTSVNGVCKCGCLCWGVCVGVTPFLLQESYSSLQPMCEWDV